VAMYAKTAARFHFRLRLLPSLVPRLIFACIRYSHLPLQHITRPDVASLSSFAFPLRLVDPLPCLFLIVSLLSNPVTSLVPILSQILVLYCQIATEFFIIVFGCSGIYVPPFINTTCRFNATTIPLVSEKTSQKPPGTWEDNKLCKSRRL